jgi:signal transduction histidine kinase
MKGRDLLKRTPFRLAATFSILVATTFVALFTVLFFGITARLEGDIRHRVQETVDALVALDGQKTFDDLVQVVAGESASVRDSDFIFELVDNKDRFLAGNVRGIAKSNRWLTLKRSDIFLTLERGEPDDEFFATWAQLAKGRLLVGISNRDVRQMQGFMLSVLGWGLLVMAGLIGAMAVFLAHQAQRRIRVFEKTLTAISQGQVGARVEVSGSGDDIDQVAVQVNRALGHLQKLIENVNQSSSDIAHDLKKPVGRLRQKLDEANRNALNVADFRAAIDSAIMELDSITETFDALLSITQLEAGARRSRFTKVDLRGILDDVLEIYAAVAEDAGDSLDIVERSLEPVYVNGDRELLTQLVANLVENSIRHSPAGTRIHMWLKWQNGAPAISVADNGPGIPAPERENVLRRLYRLERARSTPGSGLGLSLVAAIADLHEARLILADNASGLKVTVEFPEALD